MPASRVSSPIRSGSTSRPSCEQPAQPAEVVEPHVVQRRAVRVVPERAGGTPAQPDRRVADADHPLAQHPLHRLGDHPGRVGEVDDPGVRGERLDPLGHLDGDRHGAQPVRQAARAGRLLPEQAQVERHPLVVRAPGQAADPDRREDEVGVRERRVQVGGRRARRARSASPPPICGQHVPDRGETALVDVVQRRPGPPAARWCRAAARRTRGGPGSPRRREWPASRDAAPPRRPRHTPRACAGSAPSLVTSTSMSSMAHTRSDPDPGSLCRSASSTTWSAAAMSARFTRHLDPRWCRAPARPARTPLAPRKARSARTCASASWVSTPTRDR